MSTLKNKLEKGNYLNIYAVIVTYGNRFHLLKQVIDNALVEGVTKVIVVDNNSEPESKEQLKSYEQELGSDKIKVLYLDDNYGSAGGYKRGLQEAYNDKECEFIWLLDDDNEPQKDSLKALKDFWNNLNYMNKDEKIALLSYRFKKEQLAKKSIIDNKPELVLGFKNSFMGFHIKELPKKFFRYLTLFFGKKNITAEEESDKKFGVVSVAPYGGMLFHKNLTDSIGFPNEDFYLYADDHDWSYRITKNGSKLYLILDSLIDDIDISWNVAKSNLQTGFSVVAKGDPFRVYYSIRNRVFFETNNLVSNKIIYWINIITYLFLINLASRKNIKLILKAIADGYKGKLGKVKEIK